MTTKNLQYIGTDEYYFESAVTGRAQKWIPGQRNSVPNDAAAQLLATGLFRVSPVAAPEYSLDPTTGSVVGLVGPDGSVVWRPVMSYTFANLPSAVSSVGVVARVTDMNNSLWESNGSRWKPVNGKAVLKQLATEFSMSGTSAVKAFEFILPAGSVRNGDTLQMRYSLGKSGTSETCSVSLRLGSTGANTDAALSSFGPLVTTNISAGILADYKRLSATSVRKVGSGANNSAYAGQSTAAIASPVTVPSMDSAASYLTIWLSMSAAVETATLYDCVLELCSGV